MSLIPQYTIKDNADIPNPKDIPLVNRNMWKTVGILVSGALLFVLTLFFYIMNRLDWIARETLNPDERLAAIIGTWIVPIIFLIMIVATVIVGIMYMLAKIKATKLVNIGFAQTTIDMLEKGLINPVLMERYMDAYKTRQANSLYQGVTAVTANSTNNSNSTSVAPSPILPLDSDNPDEIDLSEFLRGNK